MTKKESYFGVTISGMQHRQRKPYMGGAYRKCVFKKIKNYIYENDTILKKKKRAEHTENV